MKHQSKLSIDKAPVTVIIPAYNVESCLERAISSVLEQDPPPLEVIVINDGSTDDTAEVARTFGERIIYIEQTNQGQGAARNTGLAKATGEFIAFLDADDYWLPGFIKTTIDFLTSHPEAVAVSTGYQYRNSADKIISFPTPQSHKGVPRKATMLDNFFHFWGEYDHVMTGTALIRHSTIKMAGNQQAHLRISQDLEYWGFIAAHGPWGFIPEIYWFGDSIREAKRSGWLKKYRLRRKLCPTVDEWQERIVPKLTEADWPGFRRVRGRVAAMFAHNLILSNRFDEAFDIVQNYCSDMPKNWSAKLLKFGSNKNKIFWFLVCNLIRFREYQKALSAYIFY